MRAILPRQSKRPRRSGMAFMLALFVMAVTTMIVLTILDALTLQYSALRNTVDYDRARYLSEAGIQHALSMLEVDFDLADTTGFAIPATELPVGSGNLYQASVGVLQVDGTRLVTGQGTAGTITRRLEIQVKMGG